MGELARYSRYRKQEAGALMQSASAQVRDEGSRSCGGVGRG